MEVSGLPHTGHFTQGKKPWYLLRGKPGWPQGQSGRFVEEKSPFVPAGIRTPDRSAYGIVTVLATLSQLQILQGLPCNWTWASMMEAAE